MDSFSSTYSVGRAVVGRWEFTATSSTGNLQRALHALKYEEHQTTGISAPCCETVESIIRESCHVFWGTFVKCGSVMLNRNTFLCVWLRQKKKFFPACVSDEATKPCFISALGKIFALISSKQAHFYASPTRPQRCDPRFCLLQVQKHKLRCDTETFPQTHQFCSRPKLLRHH